MWSDPQSSAGCKENSFRGGGSYFGPDVTEDVMRRHQLQRLIRSHECKIDGYEHMHNNKVNNTISMINRVSNNLCYIS